MLSLHHAVFQQSAARVADLPSPAGPEVAFAGRSNAGKSSAINALVGRTRLAFVSKTPGRTQVINFFRIGQGFLVDLPGYGYAKVPDAMRAQWHGLLEHYLSRRPSLVGLVLMMDVRRPLTELDRQMIQWFSGSGKPMHVLLTKADKLSRGDATLKLKHAREAFAKLGAPTTVQLFSSLRASGIEEAEATVGNWLGIDKVRPAKEKAPVKGEKNRGPNALI